MPVISPDALVTLGIVFNAGGFFWVVRTYKTQLNGKLKELKDTSDAIAEAVVNVRIRVAKIEEHCDTLGCVLARKDSQ